MTLKPKPIWTGWKIQKLYWIKVQCAPTCVGHILPFDRINEVSGNQNIYPIDVVQWTIVREQELQAYQDLVDPAPAKTKKTYTPKRKPPTEIGGGNGKGFGPKRT